MIKAQATAVRVPKVLASPQANRARADAEKFFARPPNERVQEVHWFDEAVYAAAEVRASLLEQFGSKCAYCESPLTLSNVLVDQFRPASGALDNSGGISPDHYWWLAYRWENLYPCCAECRSFKGQRFPVRAPRVSPGTYGEQLRAEQPLLLDPRMDEPEQHLVYAEDGSIVSETAEGQATIEGLGLNRSSLLADRSQALEQVRREWQQIASQLASPTLMPDPADVERLFATQQPFAGLRRQFVNGWMRNRRGQIDELLKATEEGVSSVAEVAGDVLLVSKSQRVQVKTAFDARQQAQDSFSVAPDATTEDYFARTRRIERIVIQNFKVIRDLDLQLPRLASETSAAPWLMLLGENGCGKSSLLQAVALALMGQADRDQLELRPADVLSHRATRGKVEVHLAGAVAPITLEFSARGRRFRGETDPKMLLLAYGATRLLPRPGRTAPSAGYTVRVANMFDPFVPIGNVTEWLLGFADDRFDVIAVALKHLLDLNQADRLVRDKRRRRVEIEAFGDRVPLEKLSDGYQSVVALATDIIAVLLERWPTVSAAEGTVLIDELGAHLHPHWRMRIVPSLRQVFPRVQFLSSTHDPLCLRGLDDGEVAVMKRGPANEILALTDLPSVAGLRVDQLLTSEHFGLNSTIDPDLDALFAEYYLLKAKPKRTKAEQRRHAELTAQLDHLQYLGSTQRERIVLEAADAFLAQAGALADPQQRLTLKQSTKQQIAAIWEMAGEGERSGR